MIDEEKYKQWVEENGEFLKKFILENFTVRRSYKPVEIDLGGIMEKLNTPS
jgi:hypothetical protein